MSRLRGRADWLRFRFRRDVAGRRAWAGVRRGPPSRARSGLRGSAAAMSEFRLHHDVSELLALLRGGAEGAEAYLELLQRHRAAHVTSAAAALGAKVRGGAGVEGAQGPTPHPHPAPLSSLPSPLPPRR